MPGFFGYVGEKALTYIKEKKNDLLIKNHSEKNFHVELETIRKFENDKVFYNDTCYFILTEGVILNISELLMQYKQKSLIDLIISMYNNIGESFFNGFRGSFSGIFYDKKNDILLIFTNHIGDKPVFYSLQTGIGLFFGSEINFLARVFKKNKIPYSLDMAGAYSLLTYSFMLSNLTYIQEIKRLTAGNYLKICADKVEIIKYHSFEYKPDYNKSDQVFVEEIDELFTNAVNLQVRKNEDYGHKHLAALSGGLDSRITTFAINRIINKPILNFTYSPVGFHDEKISKQIIQLLKNDYIYQANDSGSALLNIDQSVEANEGLMTYYGSAVLLEFLNLLNFNDYGIIHTGQIGDGILGSITKKMKHINKINKTRDCYSSALIHKFNKYFDFEEYIKQFQYSEIFSLYNKALNGVNSGSLLVFQRITESYSPFLDVDFFEYCLTIPLAKRIDYYIYDKWVLAKYPKAGKFSHNGRRYLNKKFVDKLKIINRTKDIIIYLQKKFNIPREILIDSNTPLEHWYQNIPNVKQTMDSYFDDHLHLLTNYHELYDDCYELYHRGNSMEKNQTITLLAIIKKYF